MQVQCKKLRRDEHGELVDDDADDELSSFSSELAFARDLTNHYDELPLYFPELARLKELARLTAVYKVLSAALVQTQKLSEREVDRSQHWENVLTGIQRQMASSELGAPPYATQSNVQHQFRILLAKNNVREGQLAPDQAAEARNNIAAQLREVDQKHIRTISEQLGQAVGAAPGRLVNSVATWYENPMHMHTEPSRELSNLETQMSSTAVRKMQEQGLAFPAAVPVNAARILTPLDRRTYCNWVPAAFVSSSVGKDAQGDTSARRSQVYGGVNLAVKLRVNPVTQNPVRNATFVHLTAVSAPVAAAVQGPRIAPNGNILGRGNTVLPPPRQEARASDFPRDRVDRLREWLSKQPSWHKVMDSEKGTATAHWA
jgi:hypothetical protein